MKILIFNLIMSFVLFQFLYFVLMVILLGGTKEENFLRSNLCVNLHVVDCNLKLINLTSNFGDKITGKGCLVKGCSLWTIERMSDCFRFGWCADMVNFTLLANIGIITCTSTSTIKIYWISGQLLRWNGNGFLMDLLNNLVTWNAGENKEKGKDEFHHDGNLITVREERKKQKKTETMVTVKGKQ